VAIEIEQGEGRQRSNKGEGQEVIETRGKDKKECCLLHKKSEVFVC
jgi:hypothetical protein